MSVLDILLFILGILVCLWFAIYTFLEHHTERSEQMQEVLDDIVWNDVYTRFVRPLLFTKLAASLAQLSLSEGAQGAGGVPKANVGDRGQGTMYVEIRKALLLTSSELSTFVSLVKEELCNHFRFYSKMDMQRMAEMACVQYVTRAQYWDDITNYIEVMNGMNDPGPSDAYP